MAKNGLFVLAVFVALFGAGCGVNNPTYYQPSGAVETGADAGAEITSVVTLPFRVPTDRESAALDQSSEALGFKVPWLRRDEVAISVQYTIVNLSDKTARAQVVVDGASELSSYDRAAIYAARAMQAENRDKEAPLPLIEGVPVVVPAGGSVTGTIREDDFAEAELDLDAIGRWNATPEAVLINFSEVNGAGLAMVPQGEVVPALFRVAVSLLSEEHMRLDFLVRVRDSRERLLAIDRADDAFAPRPKSYSPPPPAGP
jgi:hypothetical protein